MPQQLTIRVRPRLALVAVLLLVAFVATTARAATAATPLTVAQAIGTQNSSAQTVRGYVVGEPVAATTVNRGKSCSALRTSLHSIIKSQTVLTYDQVWNALKDTDQDPNNANNVIEIYSGRSIAKSDNGGGVDQWNREHVWATSHRDLGTANGPGTDVHHLRPEDVSVNSTRANLEPNESVGNGIAPNIGKLSVLKAWSAGDPPDAFEKRRNQVIYDTSQHNRNPFIDHPEWVSSIWP